jgi:hypothetical protein
MILYALQCANRHAFEAWFGSSAAYDAQVAAGQVSCPVCGSTEVTKAVMAPALGKGTRAGAEAETRAEAASPEALLAEMRALRDQLTKDADNVGEAFPEEARRIYYSESPQRSIYGKASPAEAKELAEEGVPVLPLPALPEDKN